MKKISYQRYRFSPHIIQHAVWLYARFTLSYRDVEDLLAERGLDISYETVRRLFLKFEPTIAQNLRASRPTPNDICHLDKMVFIIRGKRHFLWRAVESEGEESEKCRSSSHPDRLRNSSIFNQPLTITFIFNAT